jgi:hypothetical protein
MLIQLVLSIIILLVIPNYAYGVNAESCSVAHITTAIAATDVGGTVNVPAGDCDWSTGLNISKQVNIVGAGTGESGTNITTTGSSGFIYVTTGVDSWSITGFSFTTATSGWFAICVGNSSCSSGVDTKNWRIHGNKFVGYHFAVIDYKSQQASIDGGALIDNNEFTGGGIQCYGPTSDTPWEEDTRLGSEYFLFIENNTFSDSGALTSLLHAIATNHGHRVVVRYNTFTVEDAGSYKGMGDIFDAHGYCHGSNVRAVRAYEVYNNLQSKTGSGSCSEGVYLRGGTGVVYKNKFGCNAYTRGTSIALYDWRASDHDSTDGISCDPDAQNNPDGKYFCRENMYRVLTTETEYGGTFATTPSVETFTGSVSGASAEIVSYSHHAATDAIYLYFASITNGPFQSGEDLLVGGVKKHTAAANSEAYSGEGHPCSDQVGIGKSQAADPVYVWSNVDGSDNAVAGSSTAVAGFITENTDFFNSEKSGYTAYYCPHPLTGITAGTGTCNSSAYGVTGYADNLLTVTIAGTGTGTVTDNVASLSETSTFTHYFGGQTVTLTASPLGGSTFAGWAGEGCSGTGTCEVVVDSAHSVTATFNLGGGGSAGAIGIGSGGSMSIGSGGSITIVP